MTKLSYHNLQFLAVRQFHLFKRSLARSCIEAGQWNPASESCIPHHCSCYCDVEKRMETKDSCARHRKTIEGSSYVTCYIGSLLYLLFTHTHKHLPEFQSNLENPSTLENPILNKRDRVDTISTPQSSSCHISPL